MPESIIGAMDSWAILQLDLGGLGSPLLDDGGGQVMKAKLFRETCLSQGVSVLHR